MPIKWSALEVSEAMDKIEARLALAQPFLQEAHDIAVDCKSIKNLPEYINQTRRTLSDRLGYAIQGLHSSVDTIRRKIPDGAIEHEREKLKYGKQKELV